MCSRPARSGAFSRVTSTRSSASCSLRRLSPRETPLPLLTETFSFLCWDTKPVHHSRRTSLNDHSSGLRPLLRGYGWDRTWLDGRHGVAIWCGHGVFAHNLVKIGTLAS
jgi:hypothetical protein